MSLFGSLMGDLDEENVFGSHMWPMRDMNSVMNLFNDPFGMMQNSLMPHRPRPPRNDMRMMPFGFPPMPGFNIGGMFDFNNMAMDGSCHSFMSQSVMTMASGPDGRPQVYRETMSTRTAPGGIKETKKTVSDSRTGTKKMAIGHHIGDRAHILERERNMRNGDEEEHQEFINLDEDEAESFNREWETRTRRVSGTAAIGAASSSTMPNHGRHQRAPEPRQLALPSTADEPSPSRHCSRTRWIPSSRRGVRSLNSSRMQDPVASSRSLVEATVSSNVKASASSSKSRKREHKPDGEVNNKRRAVSDSDN